ncbi:MAG: DNA repair protein RadC [Clostridia bacterium]|nr:DNA repair protein RadC [Clostridia bacterium]
MTDNQEKTSINPHEGHRGRMRAKLLSGQLDVLCPHELIELLTYYSIPRRDTNELSHDILNYFNGNFSAVFEAAPGELKKIPGVGENTAALITLIKCIMREIEHEKLKEKPILTTAEEMADYVSGLFFGHQNEVFYAVFLNNGGKVIAYEKIVDGSISEISVEPRKILEAALKYPKTKQVILTHNHPSGNIQPSGSDIDTTRLITRALNTVDIRVKDHLIIAGHRYYSFLENDLLY